MTWTTTIHTPPVEPESGHVSLDGIAVIPEVKLPVTPKVRETKQDFAPKVEGIVKNPKDKANPEGSTILSRVEIA